MTTIYLTATDQVLAVSQRPKIAAGDVDSVKLHVDFDSMWDKYTGKTAVFHTSNDATIYEQLLLNGECTVPHEVLCKEGTLFIGVRGVPTDGSAIKTTTLVKQKIVKGADTGAKTLLLSPDIYQQYIKATGDGINPIVEDEIDKWDERVRQRENQLNAYLTEAKEFMSGKVVWTNSDTTASYPSGSVTNLNLTDYVRFKVVFKFDTSSDTYSVVEITEKDKIFAGFIFARKSATTWGSDSAFRRVSVSNNKVTFSAGYKEDTSSTYDNLCIPYQIIAYKY